DALNNYNKQLHSDQKSLGQHIPLDTMRQISGIPRAFPDSDKNKAKDVIENWIYPSEQMFFNAMKRKDWNPREEDMRVIVPIHNAVNEKAWKEILEWEKLHENHCGGPKLVKFQGKAKNITPKARLFNLLGYKLPFDRHDWVVDRCGKQVTYVIDFYSGQPDPKLPHSVSFYLDVRPAFTLDGAIDRFRRWMSLFMERNNQSGEKCTYKSGFTHNSV
ncbi:35565_t:CDS:2, partial [Racocetra persica]